MRKHTHRVESIRDRELKDKALHFITNYIKEKGIKTFSEDRSNQFMMQSIR
jgi:hypothetical protein